MVAGGETLLKQARELVLPELSTAISSRQILKIKARKLCVRVYQNEITQMSLDLPAQAALDLDSLIPAAILAEIKTSTTIDLLKLTTKLDAEIYNFETVEQQLGIYTNNVNGLQKLLRGEMMRFEVGESSLFLVNAREVSLISAQTTLNDLAAKRKSAYAKMLNAAGLGFED